MKPVWTSAPFGGFRPGAVVRSIELAAAKQSINGLTQRPTPTDSNTPEQKEPSGPSATERF